MWRCNILIATLIFKLIKSNQSMNSETLDKNDSFKILKTRLVMAQLISHQ